MKETTQKGRGYDQGECSLGKCTRPPAGNTQDQYPPPLRQSVFNPRAIYLCVYTLKLLRKHKFQTTSQVECARRPTWMARPPPDPMSSKSQDAGAAGAAANGGKLASRRKLMPPLMMPPLNIPSLMRKNKTWSCD